MVGAVCSRAGQSRTYTAVEVPRRKLSPARDKDSTPGAGSAGGCWEKAVRCDSKLAGHASDRNNGFCLENQVAFPTRPASLARGKG